MNPADVIRALSDPSPGFLCEGGEESVPPKLYRVPVVHRRISHFYLDAPDYGAGLRALDALPDLPSTRQLRTLLQDGSGLGLWASKRLHDLGDSLEPGTQEAQAVAGSVLVFPPAEWKTLKEEWADWQFEGLEAAFEGLPYGYDDIIPFAGPNFSPDRWLLVLRGPMAGAVCWWTHDGDSEMASPWAADVKAWGDRISAECADMSSGPIRFMSADSIDPVPESSGLMAVEYRGNMLI